MQADAAARIWGAEFKLDDCILTTLNGRPDRTERYPVQTLDAKTSLGDMVNKVLGQRLAFAPVRNFA